MKRAIAVAAIALAASAPAFSQQISFKLMGGWTFIQGDDYRTAAPGQMAFLRAASSSVAGDYRTLTNGANYQGEIITHWGRHLAVGFGGGYYQIERSDTVTVQGTGTSGAFTQVTNLQPQISAIPFFLNIYYKMGLGSKAGVSLFAGPVFQIAQFVLERNAANTVDPLTEVETSKAAVPTFGGQAGISLHMSLGKSLSLIVDGLYRYEKAYNFVGNWTYFSTASTGTTSGTSSEYYLWFYNRTADKAYPMAGFFDKNGPVGSDISNVRKAEINLSGFTIVAGLKIDL
jgi:hypothetical protein